MIISRAHHFAFIHNPKVAGTSIRKAIESYHDYNMRFWHQDWSEDANRVVDSAHIPYDDLSDTTKAVLSKCFVFGFVRDPMERFLSAVAEFRRQHADWSASKLSVNALLTTWLTPANVRHDWRFTHFCPQHYFFYSGNKCKVDYLGRHSTFSDDWKHIQALIGIQFAPLNNARHRVIEAPEVMSNESLVHFRRLYYKDYLLFGYGIPQLIDPTGVPYVNTHEQRVEMIHTPYQDAGTIANLSLGEKVAWLETKIKHYEKE